MDTAEELARARAARLEALRSLQVDAATWDRTRDSSTTGTSGLPKVIALIGIERYRKRLGKLEFDYIAACRDAERLVQRRTRRVQALVGVLAVSVVAGVVGWRNASYLQERINWCMTMRPYMLTQVRPHVLTAEIERALKPKDS